MVSLRYRLLPSAIESRRKFDCYRLQPIAVENRSLPTAVDSYRIASQNGMSPSSGSWIVPLASVGVIGTVGGSSVSNRIAVKSQKHLT